MNSIAANFLGTTIKASLLVRRINPADQGLASSGVGGFGAMSSIAGAASAGIGGAASLASMTAGDLMGSLGKKKVRSGDDLINYVKQNKDWDLFEFQYNPESIYLNSQAGSYMNRQGAPEQGLNQVTMTDIAAQTSMNFRLYFYDINNSDAFLQDKLIVSVSGAIKAVSGFICTYSVQTPVEGLVSLVTQYATRQAVFVMGKIVFFGEIENVNAQYTMFSPEGNPIAAVVDLSIRQQTANLKDESGFDIVTESDDYWDSAFENLLGKPGVSQDLDMKSALDRAGGSLLNLNG